MKYLLVMERGSVNVAGLIIALILAVGLTGTYYLNPKHSFPGLNLENNHPVATVSASPKGSTCSSNKDCGSGMICQQICAQTYPAKCSPGKCVPSSATPSATTPGKSSGGKAPANPY